jgi:hypothetical protein
MGLSDIEVRKTGETFEAVQRGDVALGEGGYFVVATGWGLTEEAARANLAAAWKEKTPER